MTAQARRIATPERWQAALSHAQDAGLIFAIIGEDPRHFFVTSGSTTGVGYLVNVQAGFPASCLCDAPLNGDPVCKHRAIILDRLGLLPRPQPVSAVAPVVLNAERIARRERGRAALAELYGD